MHPQGLGFWLGHAGIHILSGLFSGRRGDGGRERGREEEMEGRSEGENERARETITLSMMKTIARDRIWAINHTIYHLTYMYIHGAHLYQNWHQHFSPIITSE